MKIRNAHEIAALPSGEISLIKGGIEFQIQEADQYAFSAATALVENNIKEDFQTKSEVITYAMRVLGWGLARHGYKVVGDE